MSDGFVDHICAGGDALVWTGIFLEFAEGEHEGHACVGPCGGHGAALAR